MRTAVKKHKGPGAVILLVVLLLAVAGSAAWVIHTILEGNDPVAVITESVTNAIPAVVNPTRERNLPVAVMPGATPGAKLPAGPDGSAVAPGTSPALPGTLPAVPGTAEEVAVPGGDTPPPNALMVPGALGAATPAGQEDAVVRPAFISDLAAFLVQNYWPAGTHPSAVQGGVSTISLRWANLRYGAELQGLEGRGSDPARARTAILRYVLQPAAVEKIYALYADLFVRDLGAAADRRTVEDAKGQRPLTGAEKRELFAVYARYASLVASALERYAASPAIASHVAALAEAERQVEEAQRAYMESVVAHEDAAGNAKNSLTAVRLRMDKDAATYQKRLRERETARQTLVAAMSKDKNSDTPNANTLTYVAFWAYRRGEGSGPALLACAKSLTSMNAKLTAAARHIQ